MTKLRIESEVEKEFDEKFVVKSNAGTNLLRYTDANLIKNFFFSLRKEDMGVVKEVVEKLRPEIVKGNDITYWKESANIFVDKIIKTLSSLEREGK